MSAVQRLRFLTSRYGRVAFGMYFLIGTTDLALAYAVISAGIDVKPMLDFVFDIVGLKYSNFFSPQMGSFLAAYTIHKVRQLERQWERGEGGRERECVCVCAR